MFTATILQGDKISSLLSNSGAISLLVAGHSIVLVAFESKSV